MRAEVAGRVRLRAATAQDAAEIRQLDGLSGPTRRVLDQDLAAGDRCCLVAVTSDGEVVGYAAAIVQLGEAQVIDVVVAPSHRRRRLGRQLVAGLLDAVEARGAEAATLEVADDNVAAQSLYRRLGFRVEGRRPRYYPDGRDALILWRRSVDAGVSTSDTADPRDDKES